MFGTRSVAAENGCTSNTNFNAADQSGSSLVCFSHYSHLTNLQSDTSD